MLSEAVKSFQLNRFPGKTLGKYHKAQKPKEKENIRVNG